MEQARHLQKRGLIERAAWFLRARVDRLCGKGRIFAGEPRVSSSQALVQFQRDRGYTAWENKLGKFLKHTPRTTYSYDNLVFANQAVDLSQA